MEKVKGMTTCKICGRDFPLLLEEHYVSSDTKITGLAAVIKHDEPELYDSFDCPYCGCQNNLQNRKRFACPCDYGICDECNNLEKEAEDND